MNRPAEIRATTASVPNLYGRRPAHQLLADIAAGACSLAELTSGWAPMLPTPGDLVGATATVEGLRRLLGELRQYVEGVAHDG